jgi:hypothetical protein
MSLKNTTKNICLKSVNILCLLTFLFLPQISLAQIPNPLRYDSITALLNAFLELVVLIGVPVVTIAIIYAGFKFVAARGAPQQLEEAKRALVYVLVGAAIVLGAQALSLLIENTVGDLRSGLMNNNAIAHVESVEVSNLK